MAQIIQFPAQASKFGYKRVRRRAKPADARQLQLCFPPTATILDFESGLGPFERALRLDEREDSRAAELYAKAIEEQECVADAYCNLGIIQSKQGETAQAFSSFTLALGHDPRHLEAHFNLGNLYFEVDDFRLAAVHFRLAVEIDPTFPNALFNLSLVEAITGEFKAATGALAAYRKLVPPEEGRHADEVLDSLMKSLASAKRT